MAINGFARLTLNGTALTGDVSADQMGPVDVQTGCLEVLRLDFGAEVSRAAGSGQATGRRQYQPIRFVKRIDRSTPLLYRALAQNERVAGDFLLFDTDPADGSVRQALHPEHRERDHLEHPERAARHPGCRPVVGSLRGGHPDVREPHADPRPDRHRDAGSGRSLPLTRLPTFAASRPLSCRATATSFSAAVARFDSSRVATGAGQAPRSRSARYAFRPSSGTRSWPIVSRSRTVTASSSSESKSTVTQNGVPISSWRR